MAPQPSFAVFQGGADTVNVDNSAGQVSALGMQFVSNGYTIGGGALALSGTSATIRVGDGSAAGATVRATIAAALTGDARLVKDDLGTLLLTGANSYSGGTLVAAGRLIGDTRSIQGNVENNATLVFDLAGNGSFGGDLTGTGATVMPASPMRFDWRTGEGTRPEAARSLRGRGGGCRPHCNQRRGTKSRPTQPKR